MTGNLKSKIYVKGLLLLTIILYGCASSKVETKPPAQQERIVQQKEIVVEEGTFLLQNLSLMSMPISRQYQEIRIKGNVINNTTKDWNEVVFEVELYDELGNKLKSFLGESFRVIIYDIKRGETKPMGLGHGESLSWIKYAKPGKYDVRFKSGEYPATYVFAMTKPRNSKVLAFEDRSISIQFSISKKQVRFVLQNKGNNPIKIDWDQVSYVDVSGKSHKVIHSGVRYIERDRPQVPTIVPPTANVEDIVFPSDYVYYSKSIGWCKTPFFPEGPDAKIYKGRAFSIFMSLEIDGVVKNYLFTFEIEDVVV